MNENEIIQTFRRTDSYYKLMASFDPKTWDEFKDKALNKYLCLDDNKVKVIDSPPQKKPSCPSSLENWFNEISKKNSQALDKDLSFKKVHVRLSSPKKSAAVRKNADLREFKLFGSYYMVKTYFTLGYQTVNNGELHMIVTTNRHLEIYTTDRPFEQCSFPHNYQYSFKKIIIPPESGRLLVPGISYILISPLKCVFYFKVIKEEEVRQLKILKERQLEILKERQRQLQEMGEGV